MYYVNTKNAVFVEGKENFDKWEKENEVGRKVLATLRTAWLVEERSVKKRRRGNRSRYRVIQIIYDFAYITRRSVSSAWRFLSGGGTSQELSEFLRGIQVDISAARLDSIGNRLGAMAAAIVAVNITGALYTISPPFLMLLAIGLGLVWPTWFPELWDRCSRLSDETRARGRGEERAERRPMRNVDRGKYHYYVDRNRKKKYYRVTPNLPFRRQQLSETGIRLPWRKRVEPRRRRFGGLFPP